MSVDRSTLSLASTCPAENMLSLLFFRVRSARPHLNLKNLFSAIDESRSTDRWELNSQAFTDLIEIISCIIARGTARIKIEKSICDTIHVHEINSSSASENHQSAGIERRLIKQAINFFFLFIGLAWEISTLTLADSPHGLHMCAIYFDYRVQTLVSYQQVMRLKNFFFVFFCMPEARAGKWTVVELNLTSTWAMM